MKLDEIEIRNKKGLIVAKITIEVSDDFIKQHWDSIRADIDAEDKSGFRRYRDKLEALMEVEAVNE